MAQFVCRKEALDADRPGGGEARCGKPGLKRLIVPWNRPTGLIPINTGLAACLILLGLRRFA